MTAALKATAALQQDHALLTLRKEAQAHLGCRQHWIPLLLVNRESGTVIKRQGLTLTVSLISEK